MLILSIILSASFNFVVCEQLNVTDNVGVKYGFGINVATDQFPFFGFFSFFDKPTKPPICSGSIIHVRWVLTTTRCVQNLSSTLTDIIFTTGHVDSTFDPENPDHYKPTDLIAHADFELIADPQKGLGEHSKHDIGLVRLNKDLIFGPGRQAILLPPDDTKQYILRYATFVEWASYPDEEIIIPMDLGYAKLCIIDRFECSVRSLNDAINEYFHICAIDSEESVRACKPDSGAPLIYNNRLIGVATVTSTDCVGDYRPVVFTRVPAHLLWIMTHMRRFGDELPIVDE